MRLPSPPPALLRLIACFAVASLLTGCGGSGGAKKATETDNARNAALGGLRILNHQTTLRRPSAPLGMYTSMFLAQSGFTPSVSAVTGVQSQVLLHTQQHPVQMEETYALLEDFGTVLQVDLNDLLNRSQNRPDTLNKYMDGFFNITERAKKKVIDLTQTVAQLRTDEKDASKSVRDITKTIDTALKNHDYATAGSVQQSLTQAQSKLAEVTTEEKQTSEILKTYQDLVDLAEKRREAIEKNREIILSGLQVVNVPGIDDLGIIDTLKTKNGVRSRNGNGILGL